MHTARFLWIQSVQFVCG